MLASGLYNGMCFFWSPNFDSKPENRDATSTPCVPSKEPKKKKVSCKTMQALQRSLSEAQKVGIGIDALKGLIRIHKASCVKCRPLK